MEIGRHHIAVLRCDPDNIADPNGSPFICNRPLATTTRKIVYRLHSLTEGLNIASRQLTYVGHQSSSRARVGAACTNAVNIWLLLDFGLPLQFRDTTKALARSYDVDLPKERRELRGPLADGALRRSSSLRRPHRADTPQPVGRL